MKNSQLYQGIHMAVYNTPEDPTAYDAVKSEKIAEGDSLVKQKAAHLKESAISLAVRHLKSQVDRRSGEED